MLHRDFLFVCKDIALWPLLTGGSRPCLATLLSQACSMSASLRATCSLCLQHLQALA